MRAIRRIAILGAAVVAFGGIGMGTALADPPTGTVPGLTSIVGVSCNPLFSGSPTENSTGSLVADYNATDPPNKLYCWDSVNPTTGASGGTIVTKGSSSSDTTCSITRPDGSSAGITALEADGMDGSYYCIDFAVSERPPEPTDPNTIAFVAQAGYAITWASPESSGVTSPVPSTLTIGDLVDIYLCNDTNWDDFGGGTSAPIVPVLPQSGSGIRVTFLLALGAADGLAPGTQLTPGSCVVNGIAANGDLIEDNTGLTAGNTDQFGTTATSTTVDDIFPYSIADYIAQGPLTDGVGGHASSIWGHGDLALHEMTTNGGTVEAPTTTNSSGQPIINRSFEPQLQAILYVVTRNAGTAAAPAMPANLQPIFGSSGWVCKNATAQADILSYGFYSEGTNCGLVTDEFLTYDG
jgi:ABC-type phosphate transport system substrate-binding protein